MTDVEGNALEIDDKILQEILCCFTNLDRPL
jgi:hypothetical protein